MRDPELALQAIAAAGFFGRRDGTSIAVSDGEREVVVDLGTGDVVGEAEGAFVLRLRQFYAEASFRSEASRRGTEILSRVVSRTGDIVLCCRMR